MGQFDTILWDVDDTLLDFKKSEYHAITCCFEKYGIKSDPDMLDRYHVINQGYWKRLELGEVDKETVLNGRFVTLFNEYNIQDIDLKKFREDYQSALGEVYFYLDDSLTYCKSLQGKYRQYIVTNGVESTQLRKLNLAGFDKITDGIFISERVGVSKPNPKFFKACFEQIGEFDASRTIIVGDSLSSDMLGGNNAGISTCWYNPNRKPLEKVGAKKEIVVKIDFEISKLQELSNWLK